MISAMYFFQMPIGVVRVNLRGSDAGVSKHRLHRPDIGAILQKIGGERVAQLVRADFFDHARRYRVFFYDDVYSSRRIVRPDRKHAGLGACTYLYKSSKLFYRSDANGNIERKWIYRFNKTLWNNCSLCNNF